MNSSLATIKKGDGLVETLVKEVGINMEDKHELIYYNLVRGLETLEYMTYKQIGFKGHMKRKILLDEDCGELYNEGVSGSYVEGVKRRNNPTAKMGLQIGEETLLVYKNLLYGGLLDIEKSRAILNLINRLKTFRFSDIRYARKLRENMYRTGELLVRDAIMDDEVKRNIRHLGDYYNYYTNSG